MKYYGPTPIPRKHTLIARNSNLQKVQATGFIEEFKRIFKIAPYLLVGGGIIAVGSLVPMPKKAKTYVIIGGAGLLGLGVYTWYKAGKKAEEPPKTPGVTPGYPPKDYTFPVRITDPEHGEAWTYTSPHSVNTVISNPYGERWRLLVGCTITNKETGIYEDFALKSIELEPGGETKESWWLSNITATKLAGECTVEVAVWNKAPIRGVPDPTVFKLGSSTSDFSFTFFGWG